MKKFLIGFVGLFFASVAGAVDLQGTATVNVASDTAAAAKNMAFDEARRKIIVDVLRQYTDVNALRAGVNNARSAELMNLIAASSIDGERLSETAYSAHITMRLDSDAARVWLQENDIQNWLPDEKTRDVFIVDVKMSDGIANWVELNRIARDEKIDLGTVQMSANSATLELPRSVRGKFTIALREAGWRYANQEGNLKIWK